MRRILLMAIPILASAVWAQSPENKDLAGPIALYPDPLLGNVLAASTYPDQIADAAAWSTAHADLAGPALAKAIADDHLWFDTSVQALLPFRTVLDMLNRDPEWTREIGEAFLTNRADVMDAIQAERRRAYEFGYLRGNKQIVLKTGEHIEILPARPGIFYAPKYDSKIVFSPPRLGIKPSPALEYDASARIGPEFAPWGWSGTRFVWDSHTLLIDNRPWVRTAENRDYVHSSDVPRYNRQDRREIHEKR